MKVGIYDPYLDTLGGGERYVFTIVESLQQQGHQIDFFWSGNPKIIEKIKDRFSLNIGKINFVPDIFSKKVSILKKFLITRKYDLIFYFSDGSIPFLFSKNNLLHVQIPFTFFNRQLRQPLGLLKMFFINHIVCNSKFTQKFTSHPKSVVLYPPVDIDQFDSNQTKNNIILSVGRFDNILNNKRQDILIDAFKIIHHQNPSSNWRLCLAGGSLQSPETNNYLNLLKTKAVNLPIDFVINPSFHELRQIYATAKIYWHAAGFNVDENLHPENTEHFGMTVVEAMASGLVPLVTTKGGLPEIVQESSSGFLWETIDNLVAKTQLLIGSPKTLTEMSTKAILVSKNFSKQNFIDHLKVIIKHS